MFDSIISSGLTPVNFLICAAVAGALGIVMALIYMFRNRSTASMALALALLPIPVTVVIMLVNGNIGAGVAVAGAFTLVRFRSAPGTAKDIACIFTDMAIGLATGMGYVWLAAVMTAFVGALLMLLSVINFGGRAPGTKQLRVTIPESLDYTEIFDDVFGEYASKWELVSVRTTNMGSLFQLTYDVTVKDVSKEKEMIDRLRERNGNLDIYLGREVSKETL